MHSKCRWELIINSVLIFIYVWKKYRSYSLIIYCLKQSKDFEFGNACNSVCTFFYNIPVYCPCDYVITYNRIASFVHSDLALHLTLQFDKLVLLAHRNYGSSACLKCNPMRVWWNEGNRYVIEVELSESTSS